jgi:Fic family protein
MRGRFVVRTWASNPALYAPARYRRACRYEAFIPDPLAGSDFDLPSTIAGVVSDAEQAILRLEAAPAHALAPFARLLLRTESIASSRVEGIQVGVRQLAAADARRESGARVSPSVREVMGNIDAMQLAIDQAAAADRIGIEHIRALHRTLLSGGPLERIAGVIRTEQNWIGGNDHNPCGAEFVPPPPEEVEPLLDDLCAAMADDALPPVVQAALIHAQFETIHPFEDGNGRTGRALIQLVLRRRGIARGRVPPISVVLSARREQYIAGLTAFRQGDVSRWIEYFAAATARAAGLALAYARAVEGLQETWRARLSEASAPRADAAAWALIDLLPGHPVITASAAEEATGRAKSAIHHALAALEACGVLIPLSESRRNRAWEAAGLIDLLEQLGEGIAPGG